MRDGHMGPLTLAVLRAYAEHREPALYCHVCEEGPFNRVQHLTEHLHRLHPSHA